MFFIERFAPVSRPDKIGSEILRSCEAGRILRAEMDRAVNRSLEVLQVASLASAEMRGLLLGLIDLLG